MGWDKNDAIIIRGEGVLNRIVGPLTPSIPWSYDDNVTPWEYDPRRRQSDPRSGRLGR